MSEIVLSEKFNNDLAKFFVWVINAGYKIFDCDKKEQEWSINLLEKFIEPGRNKLAGFIKALTECYCIKFNDSVIGDSKLLANEFKDAPANMKKIKKDKVEKKLKNEKLDYSSLKLDMSLDTSETYYLYTFNYWTEELVTVFGKPKKTGEKGDDCIYEWKLNVAGEIYSIHDYKSSKTIDNITWYLAGSSDSKKNIKIINKYIDAILKEKCLALREDTSLAPDECENS